VNNRKALSTVNLKYFYACKNIIEDNDGNWSKEGYCLKGVPADAVIPHVLTLFIFIRCKGYVDGFYFLCKIL